jgi:hypothetical protein
MQFVVRDEYLYHCLKLSMVTNMMLRWTMFSFHCAITFFWSLDRLDGQMQGPNEESDEGLKGL